MTATFSTRGTPTLRVVLAAAVLAALAAGLSLPGPAQANISATLNDGEGLQEIASFRTARCKRFKRGVVKFRARAKSRGQELVVELLKRGRQHDLLYSKEGDSYFGVAGSAGFFSNENVPPTPPPGGGGIEFNRKGTRMALAFSPAFSATLTSSISVTGGLTCKYPRKKRRRQRR